MPFQNFHVDASISETQLLAQSEGLLKGIVRTFRQAAANGSFKFGVLELKDPDLNRVHAIVNEIDSRRVFYACGEDEIPRHAMASLYATRNEIRILMRGVWSDRSCERMIQEIASVLAKHCTQAEQLIPEELSAWSPDAKKFMNMMTEMRLTVWILVAFLQRKLGGVIAPVHLPVELALAVERAEV